MGNLLELVRNFFGMDSTEKEVNVDEKLDRELKKTLEKIMMAEQRITKDPEEVKTTKKAPRIKKQNDDRDNKLYGNVEKNKEKEEIEK